MPRSVALRAVALGVRGRQVALGDLGDDLAANSNF